MRIVLVLLVFLLAPAALLPYRFSFLDTPKMREFARTMLLAEGVPARDVETWLHHVDAYNAWARVPVDAADGWRQGAVMPPVTRSTKSLPAEFVNYRMGNFLLTRGLVRADRFLRGASLNSYLGREVTALAKLPGLSVMNPEWDGYKSLYMGVGFRGQTLDDGAFGKALGLLRAEWKKEGLRFPANPRLRIVQAVCVDPVTWGAAACDHVGLAVLRGGKVYLFEKRTWHDQFVLGEFADERELGAYLVPVYQGRSGMALFNDEIVHRVLK